MSGCSHPLHLPPRHPRGLYLETEDPWLVWLSVLKPVEYNHSLKQLLFVPLFPWMVYSTGLSTERGWLSLLSHFSSSNVSNGRKFPPPNHFWFLVVHDPLLPLRVALRSSYLHSIEKILCICACVFVIYMHVCACVACVLACVLNLYVHVGYLQAIYMYIYIVKTHLSMPIQQVFQNSIWGKGSNKY